MLPSHRCCPPPHPTNSRTVSGYLQRPWHLTGCLDLHKSKMKSSLQFLHQSNLLEGAGQDISCSSYKEFFFKNFTRKTMPIKIYSPFIHPGKNFPALSKSMNCIIRNITPFFPLIFILLFSLKIFLFPM